MSHKNQLKFIKDIALEINSRFKNLEIIEIGAHEVNGNIRQYFESGNHYTGLDLTDGPGVQVVASGHDFGNTGTYDITIACEVMEHNPYWIETIYNMVRITKPGGLVIITCASKGRIEHGTNRTNPVESPGTNASGWEYYKNISTGDIKRNLKIDNHFSKFKIKYVSTSCDLYIIGEKKETKTAQVKSQLTGWLDAEGDLFFDTITRNIIKESAPGVLTKLLYSPLWMMSRLLPDRYFQNLAIPYFNFINNLINKYNDKKRKPSI